MATTLHCSGCGSERLKKAFFSGMRSCQDCGLEHGLTSAQKAVYWIVLALMLLLLVSAASSGRAPAPGLAFFAIIYALWKSSSLPRVVVRAR